MVRIIKNVKKIEMISPIKVTAGMGTIFWQDDIEGTIKWNNGAKDATANRVYGDSNALKITSAGASAWQTDCYTKIPTNRPEVINSIIGVEMYCHLTKVVIGAGGMDLFKVYLDIYDGTNKNTFGFAWEPTGTKVQYHNSSGGLTDITGGTVALVADYYFRVKLVVDLASAEYVRLEIGAKTFDLSGIAIQQATSSNQVGEMHIQLTGIDATTCDAYIDNIMLTYDEKG